MTPIAIYLIARATLDPDFFGQLTTTDLSRKVASDALDRAYEEWCEDNRRPYGNASNEVVEYALILDVLERMADEAIDGMDSATPYDPFENARQMNDYNRKDV